MAVDQAACDVENRFPQTLTKERRLQMLRKALDQAGSDIFFDVSGALTPAQSRAKFHLRNRQHRKAMLRFGAREAEQTIRPRFTNVQFDQRAGIEIIESQKPDYRLSRKTVADNASPRISTGWNSTAAPPPGTSAGPAIA